MGFNGIKILWKKEFTPLATSVLDTYHIDLKIGYKETS